VIGAEIERVYQRPQLTSNHCDLGRLHTKRLRGSGLLGEALFFEESLGKPFHTGLRKIQVLRLPGFFVVFLAKTTIRKAFRSCRAASTLSDFSQNIDVTIESPRFSRELSFLQKVDRNHSPQSIVTLHSFGSIVTTLHSAGQNSVYCIVIARVPRSKVCTGLYRRRHWYWFTGF
jgi:hypothetical protein